MLAGPARYQTSSTFFDTLLGAVRWAWLVLCGVAWVTAVNAQQSPASALLWERGPGAESCVDRLELLQAVTARLGRPVFGPDTLRTFEGVIRPRDGGPGFEVTWTTLRRGTDEPLGTRTLRSETSSCDEMTEAIALTLAILVDPAAALGAPEPESELEPQPEPEPEPEPEREPEPEPQPEPEREPEPGTPLRFRLDAGAQVSTGLMPSVAAGATLVGGVTVLGWLGLELSAEAWPQAGLEDEAGRATFSAYGGAIGACFDGVVDPLVELSACVRGHLIALLGEGDFPLDSASFVRPLGWPSLELRAAITPRPWRFVFAVGVGIPLSRDQFFLELEDGSQRDLHRVAAAIGWIAVRIGISP